MPHCILEFSDNLAHPLDPQALFAELHTALAELEAFPASDIKSRAVRHKEFYVGDGQPDNAFVHLRLFLLSGRDISVRQRLGQICLRVVSHHLAASMAQQTCQLSVELIEIDRSAYIKATPPAAT
jgi:5-carboxymethyl-2-hydroxymuconate isomerase